MDFFPLGTLVRGRKDCLLLFITGIAARAKVIVTDNCLRLALAVCRER
jgi:hypothetical protein